jgi:hypothetical protein
LVREVGEAEVERRFRLYLADALTERDGQFASVTRFAQTFGRWVTMPNKAPRQWEDPLPDETSDEYAVRMVAGRGR